MALSYQDSFFAGIDLAAILDREFSGQELRSTKAYLIDSISARRKTEYEEIRPMIEAMARKFIARSDPVAILGRRCHAISDGFNRSFRNQIGKAPLWFFSTIGEVRHRGESVYDVTQDKVIEVLRRGFRPEEPLDVHVWLTFEDMTILDLSIMASLLRLGWISKTEYDRNPVVVGKAETLRDFEYIPYLVDNNFARKVDRF